MTFAVNLHKNCNSRRSVAHALTTTNKRWAFVLKTELWNLYLMFRRRYAPVRHKHRYKESKMTVLSRRNRHLLSRLGQAEATTEL